jgi:CRISP-associated protein Cas1
VIKRIIEISSEPMHLSVRLDQLLLQKFDSNETAASIPCEDIGMVIVDHPRTTFSVSALARLMDFGAVVAVCGRDHLPSGLLLPIVSHTEVVWRLDDQINVSKPVLKNLWKQIVVAKIKAQTSTITDDASAVARLSVLARSVRSGDPTNVEAQAARIYWSALFPPSPQAGARFRRDADGNDPINGLLNYGYAIVRAAVARALVSAGLQPAIGIHHSNRSNAFCLADDLVEPLRPMVDAIVKDLILRGRDADGVNRDNKAALLGVMFQAVRIADETGPLMVSLHRYAASLARCYRGEEDQLMIPVASHSPVEPEEGRRVGRSPATTLASDL